MSPNLKPAHLICPSGTCCFPVLSPQPGLRPGLTFLLCPSAPDCLELFVRDGPRSIQRRLQTCTPLSGTPTWMHFPLPSCADSTLTPFPAVPSHQSQERGRPILREVNAQLPSVTGRLAWAWPCALLLTTRLSSFTGPSLTVCLSLLPEPPP